MHNLVDVLTLISLESDLLLRTGTFGKVVKGTLTLICDEKVFCVPASRVGAVHSRPQFGRCYG